MPVPRSICRTVLLIAAGVGLWTSVPTALASDVRLENGMSIYSPTKPLPLQNLTGTPPKNAGPTNLFPVLMIETGHQNVYVPQRQVKELVLAEELSRFERFTYEHNRAGRKGTLSVVGEIMHAEPFDEYGRRRLTLRTARGPLPVVEGITELTPQSAWIEGITHVWEHGLATSSIPPAKLRQILETWTDPADPAARLSIVRFFIQAGFYREADELLEKVAEDFPDLKSRVKETSEQLYPEMGRQLLRELQARRAVGQHRLALAAAQQIPAERVGAGVMRDVRRFIGEYETAIERAERALLLLGDLQGELPAERAEPLHLMRSIVKDELTYDTLDRLAPFLQLVDDPTLDAEEKLALAYSGWIVGADAADTDLDLAINLFQSRYLVMQALRTNDATERRDIAQKLRDLEGIGETAVIQMIPQLPPPFELPMADADGRITVEWDGGAAAPVDALGESTAETIRYRVALPPEYSPHRRYPLIVALRPAERSIDEILSWWAGTAQRPGQAARQGYIVIAPDYHPEGQADYRYDLRSHRVIFHAIRDAVKRMNVDHDRIFLAGHGTGGDAAFDFGMSHPDLFAGVIPICGRCEEYCKYYWENAAATGWYIVGGELDRDVFRENAAVLDRLYVRGAFNDIMIVEFIGRGYENYFEEIHRIFDWMSLHRRRPWPREFAMTTLRRDDTDFYWVAAGQLPRHVVLPAPAGMKQRVTPMTVEGRTTPGNTVYVTSPTDAHTIRLSPEIVDFDKRVEIHINRRRMFRDFVRPSIEDLLDDLSRRGDRTRLVHAVLDFTRAGLVESP